MISSLSTSAEQLADESRKLPGFRNLSLPGIKEQVAQLLGLIGREGIFSTYTIHDITHIDSMLAMLDWLVPDSTRASMTSCDWLLVVLAIYLHDLGMLTTADEYESRLKNPDFTSWRRSLDESDEGREYLARMNRMAADEKERFFFQEFIRKGHAQRIREWVTGRHTRKWGPHAEAIAQRAAELLRDLPPRFREHLAVTCESHHGSDLDKIDKYPLVARFGNHPSEVADVQYAAVLLRTADLLHVTKDRTPSVMYQLIKLSDPKSVEEWDKQLGTFAVGPKGRKLIEGDAGSAVIVINADFTEERPLFSLQEYIAYADSEVRQSKRWIEKSRETPDGKDYSFPWHTVEGDVRLEGVPPQPMRFELDRGRLLDLLVGHTIYNEPTVAIRELLQNAIDAVRYQGYLDGREARAKNKTAPSLSKVVVEWDPATRMLSVHDEGVGMDRDIILHHLMNVGSSYYNTPNFEAENRDFVPISRFGIGILTCFMVSDDVEIVTFRGLRGYRIRMTSVKSTYLLRELDQGDPLLYGLEPHGTKVRLRLRDTVDLSQRSILEIVRHWVVLPQCTVEYREPNRDPIRVGYSSVQEALGAYHSTGKTVVKSFGNFEVLVKSQQFAGDESTASHELAFGVYAALYPERYFVSGPDPGAPRVCIEGIRVSQELPGFELGDERLSALLSVRGSRKFRTTVSREGLEADDQYRRVARLCAGMLFDHVQDESDRISQKPGRPLSQAASGARFLVRQLLRVGARTTIPVQLQELADHQPVLVLEQVETPSDKTSARRSLISSTQLRDIPEFWTIESRSVDSLGVISLDLGRELSLNEFLLALAPDVTQLRYSPLLPDAHYSDQVVHSSHTPDRVEFSREHQQTAIKWNKSSDSWSIDLRKAMPRERLVALSPAIQERQRRFGQEILLRMYVAPALITGDDPQVTAVTSRMGEVLQANSEVEKVWRTIRSAILALVDRGSFEDLASVLVLATIFVSVLSRGQGGVMSNVWRNEVHQTAPLLASLGVSQQLPGDLREVISVESTFDAASFWREWDRRRAI